MNPEPKVAADSGGDDEFRQLFEESLRTVKPGEVVTGRVVRRDARSGHRRHRVQVGRQIPIREFPTATAASTSTVGDEVDVYFDADEGENGGIVLSRAKAEQAKVWRDIEKRLPERGRRRRCDHRQGQRRPEGRRRCAGLSAGFARRPATGAQPRSLPQPARRVRGSEVQPRARQRRRLAPRGDGTRTRAAQAGNAEGSRRGRHPRGNRQEHHRLRRFRRPRRDRRTAARHRHVVGAGQQALRRRQRRRPLSCRRAEVRSGARARLPRHEADHARPVVERGRALSGRLAHPRQGGEPGRLRRFRRARAGHRGAGARLGDVVDQARHASVESGRGRLRGRRRGARRRHRQPPHLAGPQAGRAQSVGAGAAQSPDRQPHQGRGEEHHRLRCLHRQSKTASTAWCTSPICTGPRRFGIRPSCSRRATRSRRWCSASTSTTSACRSAIKQLADDPWQRYRDRAIRSGSGSTGTITSVTDFGVFVEIEEGIEG